MSTKRPVPTCEKCGATADPTANLPVIETRRPKYRNVGESKDNIVETDLLDSDESKIKLGVLGPIVFYGRWS
jgi:hypothetical protein